MASLVIYISSYPARPRRITVKYITQNETSREPRRSRDFEMKV